MGAKVWRWGWAGRRWGHSERLSGIKSAPGEGLAGLQVDFCHHVKG